MEFLKYIKKSITEIRPYVDGEDLTGIEIPDGIGTPSMGCRICRNLNNPSHQWMISDDYFLKNYVRVDI